MVCQQKPTTFWRTTARQGAVSVLRVTFTQLTQVKLAQLFKNTILLSPKNDPTKRINELHT